MKTFILSIVLSTIAFFSANAIVVQKVYLKNGTVLNGYIQQQDKNDNIKFYSEHAVICVDGKNATISEKEYRIGELNENWIKWAKKNDAFSGTEDNRTLNLNEIYFGKESNNINLSDSTEAYNSSNEVFENDFKLRYSTVSKVKVLEKGYKIKYLEFTPNIYNFTWDDVEYIKSDKRLKTDLSGIDRTYVLKNGYEITGQYAGETYNTLSLYTGKSGVIETFNIDDVIKYIYKGINPNQDIFEQSELLDVVNTTNQGYISGIIV